MSKALHQAGMIYPPLIVVESKNGDRTGYRTELDGNGNLTESLRQRIRQGTGVTLGLRAFGLPES